MTDGTSQGLFIVVAIVIFGIFVVLAYILFEDTLSPALANMFTTATEQAVPSSKVVVPFDTSHFKLVQINPSNVLEHTDSRITLNVPENIGHAGVYIPISHMKPRTTYILEYDLTLLEGDIYRIGGHLSTKNPIITTIDGVRVENAGNYSSGFDYALQKGKTYNIKVEFVTVNYRMTENHRVYIQPNRQTSTIVEMAPYRTSYKVQIDNTKLTEK